ncbi:MAG: Alkanesulfonate monooxygenase [Pseudomonas citronellolis]|nr:MAG: Alkanesulfonate monooxygenase [Pseudomonas citronellolis]
MALQLSWQLDTGAAAHWSLQPGGWVQVAQAAEYAGFDHLYLPGGARPPDSLLVAAALCAHTRRLGLTVALPAEAMLPAALAATLQSLQSLSGGRARLHLPDSDRGSLRRAFGELLNRDQRSERIDEFLDILLRLLHAPACALDHQGRYYQLENAGLGLRELPAPALLLDDSQGAERIAARADTCLLQAATPAQLAPRIARLRTAAEQAGRALRVACRFGVISRADETQAWAVAAERAPAAQGQPRHSGATVQQLLAAREHHPARRDEIHPNLWQPDPDQPAWLVGSHAQVATRLAELHGLGVDEVILHGAPAVRELLGFGEQVLPRLRQEEHAHAL